MSNPTLQIDCDYMIPQYSIDKPFRILIERNERKTLPYPGSLIRWIKKGQGIRREKLFYGTNMQCQYLLLNYTHQGKYMQLTSADWRTFEGNM